ncbi:hypothetical protein QEN19_001499 [Hanseniaspora menglaensis]
MEPPLFYTQQDQVPFVYEITDSEKHLKILFSELYTTIVIIDYIEKLQTNYKYSLIDTTSYNEKTKQYITKYDSLVEEIFPLDPNFLVDDFLTAYELQFKYYKGIRKIKNRKYDDTQTHNKEKASESLIFNNNAKLISEVTGNFITLMDALNLNYDKKHQIHPLLSKLLLNLNKVFSSLNKISSKEELVQRMGDFKENRQTLVNWLIVLNQLDSSDIIDPDKGKALLQDLESAYNQFYELLE